eukprot:RCo016199
MMTKLLGEQAATAAPEDIAPIELRQQTFLGISLMPIALDYMVGFRTGELLDAHRVTGSEIIWELSNNLTGYRIGGFPAESWGADWLAGSANMTVSGAHYNATMRSWYITAVQNPGATVTFGSVYFAVSPTG